MTYQRIVSRSAACYHNATILSSGMANFSRPITKQHKLISNLSCRSVSALLAPSCFPIPSARATSRCSPAISSKSIAAFLGGCPQSLVTNITHADTTTIARRTFSDPSSWDTEYEGLKARRNKSIIMHPEGQGQHILPGNFVAKKHPKTGAERKVILEHALGYFWALNELKTTDNKPIISNDAIIPAAEAEKFPLLKELNCLNDEVVDIPDFFIRNNFSKDATAQCTLVAISCKDFGARLLTSWTKPFDDTLRHGKDAARFEIVRITISEGRIAKLLSPFIVSGTKKNVPESDHASTLLFYGDAEEMRDILRMHNIYTGYVFLVDGIGRVRWAGSGEGSLDEVMSMIQFAKELTEAPERHARQKHTQSTGPRIGKKVPKKE